MRKTLEIDLDLQPYIYETPMAQQEMYGRACSNDTVTIEHWRKTWINNVTENKKIAGNFSDNAIGKEFNKFKYQPCIVAGSGPSLSNNVQLLKERKGIPLVSCLHNFHYMEDNDAAPDYYLSLDAGEVTIEEIAEGGNKTLEEYLELSKNRTLVAFIGSSPKLIKSWKGKILWFTAPIPDKGIMDEVEKIEMFHNFISSGGNVLGACFYFTKTYLGCNPIIFIGADFCFSYTKQFHAWKSKYDVKLGQVIGMTDIFGNRVLTWQSYANFKYWFDYECIKTPGLYINCSEGGTLGAYPQGNLIHILQSDLKTTLMMYNLNDPMKEQAENPGKENRLLLF